MSTSRREVLLQGCVIGAGFIAANVTGLEALAQNPSPKLRRSLHAMAPDDPILQTWRDGVRLLKAANGDVSWASFAAIHGNDQNFNLCPHGNWYFLPWHRAYILTYERAVRNLTGNNDFALPYWDWTLDRQMPPAFVEATFNGQPNPLFESQRDATPTDSLPDSTVGPDIISQILSQSPYETFGTSRPVGQNNLDQPWINCEFCGTQGTLEATPHNLVHVFVGGLMAQSNSALDPIFMMHHCNIDRIWWMWNQGGGANSSDPLWRDMAFQDNFFNPDGTRYSPKVSDLLAPEPLGYTYLDTPIAVASTATVAQAAPAIAVQLERFRSLYEVSNVTAAKLGGITSYAATVTGSAATSAKYLEIPIDLDASALAPVATRRSLSSGLETLSLAKAREQYVSGARCYAFLRDLDYAEQANTEYRVFLNCDYLSASTPTTDRHYVGSFGFFGQHGGHAHGGGEAKKPSIGVDLTTAIQRVYGSAVTSPGKLRVQIQPVALKASAKANGTAKPSRVEVAIVSA
jgi:tyrosinase